MTRFGAMKHLKVLEDAGLVATRRSGRKKLHFLNAVSIRMIHDRWIDKYREREVSALLALKATDWSATKALESMFPTTEVVPDAIFVGDGHTSPRQASRPASIRRSPSSSRTAAPGSRSTPRESSCSTFGALAASPNSVPAWPHKPTQPTSCVGLLLGSRSTPTGDLSIPALAGRAAMSERTFALLAETGMTPTRLVELVRLDRAKQLLETTRWPLARVANRSGLGSAATLARTFRRRLGVTPQNYRDRFRIGLRRSKRICHRAEDR